MSDDETPQYSHGDPARQRSVVADVTFTNLGHNDNKRERPTSSRGDSFRWGRGERLKDRLLTPPRSLSSRKSEETQRDSDGSGHKRARRGKDAQLNYSIKSSRSLGKQRVEASSSRDADTDRTLGQSNLRATSSRSTDSPAHVNTREHRLSEAPSMDPAQLVQMALNLSESRKRHASNPVSLGVHHVPIVPRQMSAEPTTAGMTGLDDIFREQIGSRSSSQQDPVATTAEQSMNPAAEHFYFSPATLARAEKARKYFELADKHRRLLSRLPPLPRNKTRSRAFSRVSRYNSQEKQQLGRAYNPLQALRNRKLREQQNDAIRSPEQFQDLSKVEQWLTQVESSTDSEHGLPTFESDEKGAGSTIGHRRAGTADTVIMNRNHDWSIGPAELLADTYWTEQGHNKGVMQNGNDRGGHGDVVQSIERPESNLDPASTHAKEVTPEKPRQHRNLIPLSAANRLRQHRFTRLNRSASVSSASSTEGRNGLPNDVNIGPLSRHMDEMIAKDAQEELSSPSTKSPDHWDPMHIRHRSIDRHSEPKSPHLKSQLNGHVIAPRKTNELPDIKQELSSPESSYPTSPVIERLPVLIEDNRLAGRRSMESNTFRSKVPLFRSRSKDRRAISTLDFVQSPEDDAEQDDGIDRSRLSVEVARPSSFRRHKTADSISSSHRELVQARSKTDSLENSKEPPSAVTRFLRGGRLGDMVRFESSKFGNKLRGRDRHLDDLSDVSAMNSDASDAEADPRGAGSTDASPRASLEQVRSRRYNIPHLPSFRSPQPRESPALQTIMSNDSSDHISRQQAELRKRNRSPRFEKLAPPRINLPDDENGSQYLGVPTDRSNTFDERRKSYGFLNPALRNRSRSNSKSRPWLGRGRSSQNTALATVSTRSTGDSRHWSISDQRRPATVSSRDHGVTSRDVARARALILASGIKAREISRRLEMSSAQLPGFLCESARICGKPVDALQRRPQREETTYAVQLLSSCVDEALISLDKEIKTFQTEYLQALITRQDKLKAHVSEDLTEMVHGASDQADSFNIDLSTQATLRTKQVDDAVDAVLRLRRRQFRVLRIIAFKLLEWVTLSLLWWVWFVVVCFQTVRRIIVGIFRLIHWLFTF